MTTRRTSGSGPNWSGVAAWVAIAVSLGTVGLKFADGSGDLKAQVRQNTRDIAEMKGESRALSRDVGDIKVTVMGIKTKLDLLLPTPAEPKK